MLCVVAVAGCFACGPSPAYEAKAPVRVVEVPADRVVEKCPCEDAEDDAPTARKPIAYVPVSEWQSPPAAKRSEEEIAASPRNGAGYVELPKLTLHQGIPTGRAYRLARIYR